MDDKRPLRREMLSLARPQLKIVAMVAIPLVLACAAVSLLETYFFLTTLRATGALSTDLARQVIPLALMVVLVILLIMVPLCVFVAVWVSHRILGPLRRLDKDLRGVGEGRIYGTFTLRDGDELTFVAEAMTAMKEGLRAHVGSIAKAQERLDRAVKVVETSPADAAGIQSLKMAAQDMKKEIDVFKVMPPSLEEPKA